MLFGRALELALAPTSAGRFRGPYCFANAPHTKDQGLQFSNHDTWDWMLDRGIILLIRFCQDKRIRFTNHAATSRSRSRVRSEKNEFVAYIDGIGKLDGIRSLLEWTTSSSCYPEEPKGRLPVLKETDRISACLRPGLDDAGDMDVELVPVFLIRDAMG
jgi:hypothetical protein